jgi:hypothetical protein
MGFRSSVGRGAPGLHHSGHPRPEPGGGLQECAPWSTVTNFTVATHPAPIPRTLTPAINVSSRDPLLQRLCDRLQNLLWRTARQHEGMPS